MSLDATFTANIRRETATVDSYGGETLATSTIYSGVRMTCTFPKGRKWDEGRGPSNFGGPGERLRYAYVLYIDGYTGSNYSIQDDDLVVPSPSQDWLPDSFRVLAVRPYYDGSEGQIQLDCEVFS